MNKTTLHLTFGVAWLVGFPLSALLVLTVGVIPGAPTVLSTIVSALWLLGLIAIFSSWAIKDAPLHGKSRYVAATLSVLWLLIPVIAIFPYLFMTRGEKEGLLASLKFASLLGVLWMGAFLFTAAIFG